jgi:3-deoxy-manno-octulosonate cytidylyltransferase (CMP-KDO synthetase)
MQIIGIVPARMAASRFPGKPLYPIHGKPMVEHVFARAQFFKNWTGLYLATCDREIEDFGKTKGWPVIMTSDKHTRCLDRVAEATTKTGLKVDEQDIVVCVQGDEPMLHPEMIDTVIAPLFKDKEALCTVLSMDIHESEHFYNPNVVKIIHDMQDNVLYTSRAPVPYCKKFGPELGAKRIYGIFAFRWHFLKTFTKMPESPLELAESCDSNRICDNGFRQKIAPYPYVLSFSVDSPSDVGLVEAHMKQDPLWGKY